ncbi:MAG: hypothetical protein ACI4JQ_00335 [Ruminococcus sp.]
MNVTDGAVAALRPATARFLSHLYCFLFGTPFNLVENEEKLANARNAEFYLLFCAQCVIILCNSVSFM